MGLEHRLQRRVLPDEQGLRRGVDPVELGERLLHSADEPDREGDDRSAVEPRRDEPLDFQGEFYQHPYHGEGAVGLGKPLRIIIHPQRPDVPIFIGSEGPKNVRQTAEIADGWLPLYYSPYRQEVYADQLAPAKAGFEINALATLNITDDVKADPKKLDTNEAYDSAYTALQKFAAERRAFLLNYADPSLKK